MPTISTESTSWARSQSSKAVPSVVMPSKPEYAARVLALVEDQPRIARRVQIRVQLGAAGADDAVRRPGVDVVRCSGEVRAGVDVVVAGGDGVVVVARRPVASLIARATAAPPATASEPPSQKSFCTSTTISAVP